MAFRAFDAKLINGVTSASSFSGLRKLLEDVGHLQTLVSDSNWEHLLTAVRSCGYKDHEFAEFLRDVRKMGCDAWLKHTPDHLKSRSHAKLEFLLSTLVALGLLEASAPAMVRTRGLLEALLTSAAPAHVRDTR